MADEIEQDGNVVDSEQQTFVNQNAEGNIFQNCEELHYFSCVLKFVKENPEDTQNVNELKTLVQSARASVNFQNNKDLKTALHWAVLKKKAKFVDVLLEGGAEIKKDNDGNTALHYAVQQEAFDIFKRLMPREIFANERWTSGEQLDAVTLVNTKGFNVLDLALESMNRQIVEYIILETSLRRLMKLLRNNTGKTNSSPFRGLIKKMPDIAKEVMDRCITRSWNWISFNYEFLDDTFCLINWPQDSGMVCAYTTSMMKIKENHPLKLMIKGRRTDGLLDHPLVKALARRKWNHIGVKFHVLNLALYLIFLAVLTVCVCTTVPPYINSHSNNPFTYRNTTACQNVTLCQNETSCQNGNTCKNTTICHNTTTCLNRTTTEAAVTKMTCHSFESSRKSMIVDLQCYVIALSLIMLLKEFYQLVRMYGCHYFKQKENYVELAVYICSVLFVVNVTDCEDTDYRTKWQWVLGTLSVFMAWINLLYFTKKFDRLGIYAVMFWSIIKTFLVNVFPIVAVLLMAFAIAFTCIHQDQEKFANVWHSILTTTSFLISGFDYEEFLNLVNYHDTAFVSYIIYSLFQFLMTIVIINLMVGVAVENVQEIHKDASAINNVLQIEFTLEIEAMICFIISNLGNTCKNFRKWFILKPEEKIELTQLKSTTLPVQQIKLLTDMNRARDEQHSFQKGMEMIEKQMTELNSTIKDTNERMNTFETKMTELNSTIKDTNKRMNTVETKLNELSSIKAELRSINEVLNLQKQSIYL